MCIHRTSMLIWHGQFWQCIFIFSQLLHSLTSGWDLENDKLCSAMNEHDTCLLSAMGLQWIRIFWNTVTMSTVKCVLHYHGLRGCCARETFFFHKRHLKATNDCCLSHGQIKILLEEISAVAWNKDWVIWPQWPEICLEKRWKKKKKHRVYVNSF